MADDNQEQIVNKLDETLKALTGMSQKELDARRAQKQELVAQRQQLEDVRSELEGLGKESVKSSKFLKMQNKLAEDEKKFERKKFTDMLRERARAARASIVQGPGAAVTALGTGIKEGAGKAMKGIGGVIKGLLGPAGIFGLMLLFLKALQNPKFREVVSSLITFVKGVFTNTFDFLKDAFDSIVDLVSGVTDKLGTIFGGDATVLERVKALAGIFTDFGTFILNIGDSLITNVLEMFGVNFEPYDSAGAWLLGKLNDMWTGIKNFFTGAVEFVQDGYTNIKDWIIAKVSSAWQSVKDWFFGTVDFVVDGATNIKDWLVSKVTAGWANIKAWFTGAADFAVEGFNSLKDFLGDKLSNSTTFVKDLFSFSEEDMTAKGITSKLIDTVGAGINLGTNFAKDIFGFGNPDEPFKLSEFLIGEEGVLSRLGKGIVGIGKKIYDSETGQIFGTDIPEIPSISDMFTGIKNLAKKIYNPETGAIFGFVPGDMFDFNLPNFNDLFMNLAGSMLPKPESFVGRMLYKLPGTGVLKEAATMFGQGGKIVEGKFTMPGETTTTDTGEAGTEGVKKLDVFKDEPEVVQMSLDEVNARIGVLESLAEDAELASDLASEKIIRQRIDELSRAYDTAIMEGAKQVPVTVIQGGNKTSVANQNSTVSIQKNTGFTDPTIGFLTADGAAI